MRYRGKCIVTFHDDKIRTIDHVVNTDDIEKANKICAIEFHGSYKRDLKDRVKRYDIIPCIEDTMERPSAQFVEEKLRFINDLSNSESSRRRAKDEIYNAFRAYQPSWDDDSLSDILSYCDEGICEKYGQISKLAKDLVEELDGMWCCHYRPAKDLDEQYQKAIDLKEKICGRKLNSPER